MAAGLLGNRLLLEAPWQVTRKHEYDHDDQYEPQTAAGTIAPTLAVGPTGKCAQQQQQQKNH
tara:strand:- start:452 stop:637 length:186 start_codon:yes stop_codon:yes gene_type:complete